MNRLLWNKLQNSLLLRLGGMIAAITVLAVVGMSTSWMVAETTQGNGEAINVAGSLRMQSWRMASLYQRILQDPNPTHRSDLQQAIQRFETDLAADSILSVLPTDETTPLKQVYRQVESGWQQRIKPDLIPLLTTSTTTSADAALLDAIPQFVAHINDLVKQIEEATEAKILVLRVILGVAVIGTILAVILSIYLVNNIFVTPLKGLLGLTWG